MPQEKKVMTPDEMVAYRDHLREVQTLEARVRSAESRLNVHQEKAAQNPDRYQELADESQSDLEDLTQELQELQEKTTNWGLDLEGTKAELSDIYGNHAANARVARAGGTRIKGSNSIGDSGGEPAEDPEEAGDTPETSGVVVLGVGNVPQTLSGKRVELPEEDLEEDEDTAGVSGDEQAGPSKARSARKSSKSSKAERTRARRSRKSEDASAGEEE
jgi:hypothetical protein